MQPLLLMRIAWFYQCDPGWLETGEDPAPIKTTPERAALDLAWMRWYDAVARLNVPAAAARNIASLPSRASMVRQVWAIPGDPSERRKVQAEMTAAVRSEVEMWCRLLKSATPKWPKGKSMARLIKFAKKYPTNSSTLGGQSAKEIDILYQRADGSEWKMRSPWD